MASMQSRVLVVPAIGLACVATKAAQLGWFPDPGGRLLWPGLARQAVLIAGCTALLTRLAHGDVARAAGLPGPRPAALASALAVATFSAAALLVGSPPTLSILTLVAVTGFGEELLFRGLMLGAAEATGHSHQAAPIIVSVLFGLWHVPAASPNIAVAVVATTLASLFVLIPLRRRTGSLLVAAAAHTVGNGIGLLVTSWS
jgi:membrane protease YdiL (CAAX protease family)